MENKKSNYGLIIIICILLVIISLLIGYIVGINLGKSNNSSTNDSSDKNDEVLNYDLKKAEDLVAIYSSLIEYGEDGKASIAFVRVGMDKVHYVEDCGLAFGDSTNNYVNVTDAFYCYSFGSDLDSYQINYDDVNARYKYLFGENLNLEKKDYLRGTYSLAYSSKNNSFVRVEFEGSGYTSYTAIKIDTAKVEGNNLNIIIFYSDYSGNFEYFDSSTFKSGYTGIEYGLDEEQKYIDNEYQYFEQYKFVFEYETDHYILKDIVKL